MCCLCSECASLVHCANALPTTKARYVAILRHPSRALLDFSAAKDLISLKLTAKDCFGQAEVGREYRRDGRRHVMVGVNGQRNLLSQLSADLYVMVLTMITGLGNVRTMALFRSLSSELTLFDMRRVKTASVYMCEALFVERYWQNLFDEKWRRVQQPGNLREFQMERQRSLEGVTFAVEAVTFADSAAHSTNTCRP